MTLELQSRRHRAPDDDQMLREAGIKLRGESPGHRPEIVVVLGSGLGDVAEQIEIIAKVSYAAIPGFATPSTAGHQGFWIAGTWSGRPVVILQGRLHRYEGRSWEEIVFPIRCAAALGVRTAVFTNMNGAINPSLRPGELLLVRDHLNFMTTRDHPMPSTFEVSRHDASSSRNPYSARLRQLFLRGAELEGLVLPEGVYAGVTGPNYETPAEIRAFGRLGADVIGMSTIGEVLCARALGLEVAALSCVANMAAGVTSRPIFHEEVLETAMRASQDLRRLLSRFLSLG